MPDAPRPTPPNAPRTKTIEAGMARRRRAEWRFRAYGVAAIVFAASFLVVFIINLLLASLPAFSSHELRLPITYDTAIADPRGLLVNAQSASYASEEDRAEAVEAALRRLNFSSLLHNALRAQFPEVTSRSQQRALFDLVASLNIPLTVMGEALDDPQVMGRTVVVTLPLADDIDLLLDQRPRPVEITGAGRVSWATRDDGEFALTSDDEALAQAAGLVRSHITASIQDLNQEAVALEAQAEAELAPVRAFAALIMQDPALAGADRGALMQMVSALTRARFLDQYSQLSNERARTSLAPLVDDQEAFDRQLTTLNTALAQAGRLSQERLGLLGRILALQEKLSDTGGVRDLDARTPSVLLASGGGVVKITAIEPGAISGVVLAAPRAGEAPPGEPQASEPQASEPAPADDWTVRVYPTPEEARRVSDQTLAWTQALIDRGVVHKTFNTNFLSNSHRSDAELAGIAGALIGSLLTMLVTMTLAVPIGIGAAIYLEEFAPKNAVTDFIEININNLAAVPSIIFGLLGLAIVVPIYNAVFDDISRGWPLVGGTVLALMTLPTIIISTRAALRAVPQEIRDGALALGASRVQTVLHHVLPLAGPGIMTGSIIGLAQALGETAPLIMIGMVAAVPDVPGWVDQPATTLSAQILLWSGEASAAFRPLTAAAIIALLAVMIALNLLAVVLRRRFERRW